MRKLIPFIMALCLLPAVLMAQRSKQSRAALENRKEQLLKEIAEATRALQETRKSTRQNQSLQKELQAKISSRNEQIKVINTELSQIEGDIANTSSNVETLEKEVDSLRARYAQLLVYSYKSRTNYDVLNFLFSATSFNDALRRYEYLRQYRESKRRQAESMLSTRQLLGKKLAELHEQRKAKTGALYVEQRQKIQLVNDQKETAQTIRELQDKQKDLQQSIAKSKAEAKQIDNAIQAAIRREIEAARRKAAAEAAERKRIAAAKRKKQQEEAARKALAARKAAAKKGVKPPPEPKVKEEPEEKETSSEDVLVASPGELTLSKNFEANRGRLPWPVSAGRIVGHFGMGMVGKVEKEYSGVVFHTSVGAAVKAIFEGEVIMVFNIQGSGYMVTLRHGKYFTNYVHLLDVKVNKGAKVARGQTLGVAAASPGSSNGQIELQIYKNVVKQNPERWIRAR
ncbi:Septal ring factor EnvC, activator of murein hydrolases AmiA and AmiB [Chitinophaga jiangningensis]|uniref:Septal ring factor EnvC, activator of murein hydrolases AmiA and AmiB n=1 Tax=Chitinophaga jiangningensis TaxID=1419482 RepID=A0A1M7HAL8_9BACT|nr:peptidoglycan DD-metalloendopeptidase family protein [Chitinophaga jiangningensis]SHM25500.1 Septal ring factor EnvC, activator of murein hydrolases AmiA and AmiB [Chitinophaga jiangningensis]